MSHSRHEPDTESEPVVPVVAVEDEDEHEEVCWPVCDKGGGGRELGIKFLKN